MLAFEIYGGKQQGEWGIKFVFLAFMQFLQQSNPGASGAL
jgi:hypothetical protein